MLDVLRGGDLLSVVGLCAVTVLYGDMVSVYGIRTETVSTPRHTVQDDRRCVAVQQDARKRF